MAITNFNHTKMFETKNPIGGCYTNADTKEITVELRQIIITGIKLILYRVFFIGLK